jgi:hypothetical protein
MGRCPFTFPLTRSDAQTTKNHPDCSERLKLPPPNLIRSHSHVHNVNAVRDKTNSKKHE